ncbi:MAG: ABC transporter ATP-binding protein [Nitrososphaeraceae archaeon]
MITETAKYGEMKMEGVYKVYGSLVSLADCSFDIPRGKFTCLVGPSGSGKSVLVRLLAGYEIPDGGTVTIDGERVSKPGPDRIVVFQESALLPWKTLMENTIFGPVIEHKLSIEESKRRAQILIDKSGLTGFENKYPFQLSGGMQRRAEVIRVLINEPRIMLMDEPFRGLDAMTRQIMQEYVIKMYEETGMTILFITSEIDEAIYLGDRVYFLTLRPGKIKHQMDIDLPRPRKYHTLTSNEFFRLRADAIDTVMGEVEEH